MSAAAPGVLLTGAQCGEADEAAVAGGGSWEGLLARAGGALARGVLTELRASGGTYGRRALVVVGKGDNGGDGWVAARRLRAAGVQPTVVAVHGTDVATSDHSGAARHAYLADGGRAVDGLGDADLLDRLVASADVAVDCVLGTGIHGAPRATAAAGIDLVARVGARGRPVVACDVPSGVDADTGAAPGAVATADRTVTFGAAVRGLALHPGAALAGVVEVAPLGPGWSPPPSRWRATDDGLAAVAPPGTTDDKQARGQVLVVAGSQRYGGAAALCAAAAVRSGAGLVTCATTADAAPVLALEPGVMVAALPADGDGFAATDAAEVVAGMAEGMDAVVLGPGMGHGDGTRAVADALLAGGVPLVLDADGINVFRGEPEGLRGHAVPLVLTPHHRELSRLTGVDPDEALARRHELVPTLAADLDAVVLGKGPGTVVAAPDGRVWVATTGGPALGTGGSGDVLAGMVGAAVAAGGDDPARAAAASVHRHGLLGARAGADAGGFATAHQLLGHLPGLLAALATGRGAA